MLLSYHDLCDLVRSGFINADPKNINGASIDVRLGNRLLIERKPEQELVLDLRFKETHLTCEEFISQDRGYILQPGQCVLAETMEVFNLPNTISCEFKLKSSIARCFVNNMLATWCDPGWHNSKLTLELKNDLQYHSVILYEGMKIGQMIFYRVHSVPDQYSYATRGRYNNTTTVTASKGV